jgi:hypothetical protein
LLSGIADLPDRLAANPAFFRNPMDRKNSPDVLMDMALAVDVSSWSQPFARTINGLIVVKIGMA